MTERRLPRLVLAAWVVTVVVLVALALAVWRHLASTGDMSGMGGMQMSTADALTRGGTGTPTSPLLGSALITAWQLDAVALAVIVLLAALYLTGVALVPSRSAGERWPVVRAVSFLLGLLVCAFATNGSVAVYDQVLFSAHMLGHLCLVMLGPALLMGGRPLRLLLASAKPARRARLERVLTGRVVSLITAPPVTLATYTAVIVGSHLTGVMNTIMRDTWAGQVEHLVYLLAGCQFFVLIVGDEPIRWRLGSPARWLLLAIAMAVDTFTGIVLMQGTTAVSMRPSSLHVSALSDTRTGGAIMWFGGDGIMAAIMVVLVIGYLRSVESEPGERGWLAQARMAAFDAHTAAAAQPRADVDVDDDVERDLDSDEAARDAYNAWLQKLDAGG